MVLSADKILKRRMESIKERADTAKKQIVYMGLKSAVQGILFRGRHVERRE